MVVSLKKTSTSSKAYKFKSRYATATNDNEKMKAQPHVYVAADNCQCLLTQELLSLDGSLSFKKPRGY
jgi:hypothetical protein